MENEGKDKQPKSRYCVLFTQTLKQWEVTEVIKRRLPEDRGTVFYPCAELWMGSLGTTVIEPLFPGYVFIRSDMAWNELHDFIRGRRGEVLSFIKELRIGQERAAGRDISGDDDDLSDLNDEEAELLDFMLGFRYGKDKGFLEEGKEFIEIKAGKAEKNGKMIRPRRVPRSGVLAMSYGYREKGGRYVVMEGPLRGQEDRIVDVNPKDRRASLNLKIGGRLARVGLEIKSKKYWYPNDKEASVILSDGYEINPSDIAAAMMRNH